MEKVQWNSIDKKQNGLKYSKNENHRPSPGEKYNNNNNNNNNNNKNIWINIYEIEKSTMKFN